jgi:hypothetical protein
MITLRIDEKALETVLRLATLIEDRTPQEDEALLYVAREASKSVNSRIEEIEGAPIP